MPFVSANRVHTYFEATGEGPPLLLIAGNGMDHTTFRDQVPRFAQLCLSETLSALDHAGAWGNVMRDVRSPETADVRPDVVAQVEGTA